MTSLKKYRIFLFLLATVVLGNFYLGMSKRSIALTRDQTHELTHEYEVESAEFD